MVKQKKPLIDIVKQGSLVFTEYNKAKLSVYFLRRYYCKTALYSLHKMLLESERVLNEYKEYHCVYNDKEITKPISVPLDHWVYDHNSKDLFECYLVLNKQLLELINLAEINNHKDHIERRCFKIFHTYITIVELLIMLR